MIKVSEDIKKLYIEDGTPIELEVRVKDNAFPTIKGLDVLSEQMTLHESICEEEQLKFGGCNASSFELTVYGLDKSVKGKEIMPALITSKTEIPLGVFCVDTVEKFAGKDYVKITAYDRIKYFDKDVKDWYKNLVFPITIKNFRDSLCEYIGIEQNEASLIVDDIVIQKDIDYTSNVNGLTILQNICEISGVFGRMDRYGKLDYLSLTSEKMLDIPSSLVYEYPVVEDYETKIIDGAIIVDSEGAEYATDNRTNPYYIRDNFVIIGQTEATIKSIAKKLVEKINGIKYVPVSISKIKGQPYAECGDYVHGEIKGYTFDAYIFQREIIGIKALRDSYVAKGKEYLENDINSVTSTLLKLNEMIGRTRTSIKKTEEGLTIDIQKAVKASNKYSDSVANTAKSEAIRNTDEKLKNYSTTEEMQTAIKASEKGFSVIVSSTIKNSVEEFYLSNSPTSLIGGSWSKTQPTWTDGKYIWQRTLITRGNDETEYSPSEKGVCITGNTGAKGDPGEKGDPGTNGKSIGSVVNYYLATNLSSDVSTSTTGWTTSVQSVSKSKKYLWNYEVIKYTDDTVASTTTPCIIGSYGDTGLKGDPGVGISSITEHYAASPSNTTAPTSWSTTVPTMTTTNKYLWNYETVAYTNNTSKDTGKRVIGVYGDKGSKGDAGKGVQSSKITYQASSSGTAVPTGTWSDSIPSVSAGQYLWTKTVITYTDNTTSTSYSVGRNGTNGKNGNDGKGIKSTEVTYQAGASATTAPTCAWQSSPQTTSASFPYMWTKTVITYTDNTTSTSYSVGCTPDGIQVGGRNLIVKSKLSVGYLDTNGSIIFNSDYRTSDFVPVNDGEIYTISWQKDGGVSNEWLGFFYYKSDKTLLEYHDAKRTGNPFTITITVPSECKYLRVYWKYESGGNVKLEKGNKATDWTPAPEDVDAQIQAVSTQVTEAQTEISSTKENITLLATKTEVTTVSNNLTALSRTVSNQQTAIEQNAESISLRATKDEVTTAVNDIQVGGRNLIPDSHILGYTHYAAGNYLYKKKIVDDQTCLSKCHVECICTNAGAGPHFPVFGISADKIGNTYTWSFEAKCSANRTGTVGHECGGTKYIGITTEWQKFTHTWTFSNSQYSSFVFYLNFSVGDILYIRDFKIESGNKATDWSPAPDDQVEKAKIISEINQSPEQITIKASKISLEGLVTANQYFKVLTDGSIEAVNGKFTGEIHATSGSFSGDITTSNATITGGSIVVKCDNPGDKVIDVYWGEPNTEGSEPYYTFQVTPGSIYAYGYNGGHAGSFTLNFDGLTMTGAGGNINTPGSVKCDSINASGNLTVSGTINGRTWYWSGQGGQPSWLWGGNDGANMYVYNPANFSVNYATSSGSTNDGRLKGLNRIRTGTVVLGSDRGTGTSRLLFNLDYVKKLLGSSNVSPYDVAIVVNNGDAEANGGHPHGVTYAASSKCFYVIFKDQVGTNPIRINFAIIWGTGN